MKLIDLQIFLDICLLDLRPWQWLGHNSGRGLCPERSSIAKLLNECETDQKPDFHSEWVTDMPTSGEASASKNMT